MDHSRSLEEIDLLIKGITTIILTFLLSMAHGEEIDLLIKGITTRIRALFSQSERLEEIDLLIKGITTWDRMPCFRHV